jgi:hypothetical protein
MLRQPSDFDAMSEGNLDAKGEPSTVYPENMLFVLGIVATLALAVGVGFIFSKTAPSMPNKICRFVFLFALWVPLNFVFNYVNVWAFGFHRMSWTGAIIIAVLLAGCGTFLPPQPHDPKTQ